MSILTDSIKYLLQQYFGIHYWKPAMILKGNEPMLFMLVENKLVNYANIVIKLTTSIGFI